MKQMEFYHYTSPQNFCSIETGTHFGQPGLRRVKRFLPIGAARRYGLPEKAEEGVIFGLLDPMDKTWCRRIQEPGKPLLETMLDHIETDFERELCSLKVSVSPGDDVYVANYIPSPKDRRDQVRFASEEDAALAVQIYWNSLVPLDAYLQDDMNYMVPEVVCFSSIPRERVRINQFHCKHDLINQVRQSVGFSPHPAGPEPDYTILDQMLDRGIEPEASKPQPPKPKGSHLRLV